jgi:hypothetical protein
LEVGGRGEGRTEGRGDWGRGEGRKRRGVLGVEGRFLGRNWGSRRGEGQTRVGGGRGRSSRSETPAGPREKGGTGSKCLFFLLAGARIPERREKEELTGEGREKGEPSSGGKEKEGPAGARREREDPVGGWKSILRGQGKREGSLADVGGSTWRWR